MKEHPRLRAWLHDYYPLLLSYDGQVIWDGMHARNRSDKERSTLLCGNLPRQMKKMVLEGDYGEKAQKARIDARLWWNVYDALSGYPYPPFTLDRCKWEIDL